MIKIRIYLKTLRLKNIVKNITIFLPVLFSGEFITNFNLQIILDLLNVSLSFFFISGLVYIFNDLEDILEDQKHPNKKNRPIAAGLVSKNEIKLLITTLVILFTFSIVTFSSYKIFLIIQLCCLYLLINVLYTKYVKKINAIIGSAFVSFGFFIRLLLGSLVAEIELKIWLIALLILSTFFISILKKYSDAKNKSVFNYKVIIFTSFLLITTYMIHFFASIEYQNNLLFTFVNLTITVYIIYKITLTFTSSNLSTDPVEYLLKIPNTLLSIFWFLSYIYLRYIL
jgi:decaprenyl-phosphate phosphoribosyltransferase